ncbi:hypothetical protein SAY87_008721 [Trapa incisa]|uniref:Protein FLX-like 2 n=1 Tax=Trapa incisa TaxID=236973 RepID=A0AAN7JY94_9MYRT|nr:hypothetical protein SAY87_008721 [Trapa incisa]
MSSRGRRRSNEEHTTQTPGLMRHGPILVPLSGNRPVDRLEIPVSHVELLENKFRAQAAEIEQLVLENRRLASTQVFLREELVSTQKDAQRVKAHFKSIQTESDIQIRILHDKIIKFEADIRSGEGIRKDLENAHKEVKGLVAARQDLMVQIQQANQELKMAHADAEKLRYLSAEYDSLMQELHRLQTTFEYEKGLNLEQVRQMQAMEQNLFSMAREVENLQNEVTNAEKKVHAPNPYVGGLLSHPGPSYPHQMQGKSPYMDSSGRPLGPPATHHEGEDTIPYSGSDGGVGPIPSSSGSAAWTRPL